MAELRIPREEERIELERQYECVRKGCIYVEALLSVTYSIFNSTSVPRVRCTAGSFYLTSESKICGNFKGKNKNEHKV
ncbi:MAG: hypothetical protein B6227_05070 [Fusobacteriia bacterium 4572_74]|nr:MAG: hypothetical protein B6227_05070 [Fusobacteriia bacterium 4572_74]